MSIAKITITQTFDITEETIEKAVEAFLDNYDYGDSTCINATYLGFIADQLIDSGNSQMDEMWKVVIFENLKNNAEKYAKTPVEITLEADELTGDGQAGDELTSNEQGYVKIHFRDFGSGISDEEMPFITGKFYRGKNVGSENGSGLGLYIVKELMTKMEGDVSLYNKTPGLDVVLTFKCGTDV